jgi:8-oxo-dGTP diphosphatase
MPQAIPIALALIWKQSQLLIARRPAASHLGGFWEFPGGRIEVLESPETAAVREAAEELTVQCVAVNQRASFYFEYLDRKLLFFPIDCSWVAGEPKAVGALHPRWVDRNEINSYEFPPANQQLLLSLKETWRR